MISLKTGLGSTSAIALILSLRILSFLSISAQRVPGNETDKLSLLAFKAEIHGDPLGLLDSWNETVHFCAWPGIRCSRRHHQRVTVLTLPSWQLSGRLSPHIGNLSFLHWFDLQNNSFTDGTIPPEIGRLSRLEVLIFKNSSFGGEIPTNVTGCRRLWYLNMGRNRLSGRIPADIGLLTKVESLELSVNNLIGEIPASIGNMSSLLNVYLAYNELRGSIPSSLSRVKRIECIAVGLNNFTGTVPASLYNISTLKIFSVDNNKLEGTLPSDLGHTLPNLNYFSIHTNKFSGTIPASMSNASNLVNFEILSNNFTGNVPSFRNSPNLQSLKISYNNLGIAETGDLDFLHDLINCTNLDILGINSNNLGGKIPQSLTNMSSTKLRVMAFGQNQITGNIPQEIGNLVTLQGLGFQGNYLTGPIPSTIGKLKKLVILTVWDNKLSGEIPTTLGNLTSLISLYLKRNNIHGSIPSSLAECTNLEEINLSENMLSGQVPPQLFTLSSFTQLLDLSKNQLIGPIPMDVGKLVNLEQLDISENKLSGEIPKALGSCIRMEYLYLQGNLLLGPIPVELNSLRGVRVIDLSRNNLSGQFPKFFLDFRGILYLNFSFNELEGQVPVQGVFKNASKFSVTGNTRLCGGIPELRLPLCTTDPSENHKMSKRTKLFIIVSFAILGLTALLFLIILSCHPKKRSNPCSALTVGTSLQRVSYGDLYHATDSFSSTNLIGAGSFGSVFKGILNQENIIVAIKVLNLDVSHALKCFVAECESLRNIRHRNLVKLLTTCSSIDFQGNDFKALVFEFMENGNLEEGIHSYSLEQGQSRCLNLIQRINIAIDVASALDYLHNHCSEPIVHCDIKPSNILLDGQMVAHVGDFGLAKLLRSTFSNQSSSVGVRGTVGYVAPEYAMGSEVSTLGDIYSYGILLLELFTGKRPTDNMFKDDYNLNKFASSALPDCVSEILDPVLLEEEQPDQTEYKYLVSVIELGVACPSNFPGKRMNIGDVDAELQKIRNVLVQHRMPHNLVHNA